LKARDALGLVYLLTGAVDEEIAWDRQTAKEFPFNRSAPQRLVYGLLRNAAAGDAQSVVDELMSMDSGDRWTRDLAGLVTVFRKLGDSAAAGDDGRLLQIQRNYLLWRKLPVSTAQTWALENAMPTEALVLSPAKQ
jgi:hypothetical protein